VVVDGTDPVIRGQFDLGGTSDEEDRIRAAGPEHADAALGEGLTVQFDERLRPAEPGALPRGQQHPRNSRNHHPQAYALSLVGSIAAPSIPQAGQPRSLRAASASNPRGSAAMR